jgi:mono/diheme cytochrome c family protein
MSTSLGVILKRLFMIFVVVGIGFAVVSLFSYDVIKIQWVSFMGLQPSYGTQEEPRPVPPLSIPVEGAASVPGGGAPINPVPADEISIARGTQLFAINCVMCHGVTGQGTGVIAAFLVKKKPADLTSALVQTKTDGNLFISISYGIFNPDNTLFPDVNFSGQMPPMNENLNVRERWDVINYIRTLKAAGQ